MRYSTFEEIGRVLATSLNYFGAATKVWFDALESGEGEELENLERNALSLVVSLYEETCVQADRSIGKPSVPLLSELISRVDGVHQILFQALIFEALSVHPDCPPQIREALGKARETSTEIGQLLWNQGPEMAEASQLALIFISALENDVSVEEASEKLMPRPQRPQGNPAKNAPKMDGE